tara:strand:+ start:646 stop:912 length:267 start_codon:yes stop_codon:yes gene_type:complete
MRETKRQKKQRKRLKKAANKIAKEFGFKAIVMKGVYSVGVKGDERAFEPVVEVIEIEPQESFDYDKLQRLSTKLTNELDTNRIALRLQ